jgi:hypothetical protein
MGKYREGGLSNVVANMAALEETLLSPDHDEAMDLKRGAEGERHVPRIMIMNEHLRNRTWIGT